MHFPLTITEMHTTMNYAPYTAMKSQHLITGIKKGNKESVLKYQFDNDGDINKIDVYVNGVKTDTYTFDLVVSGIKEVTDVNEESPYFSLQGYQVTNPRKGIFVRNGRKIVVK